MFDAHRRAQAYFTIVAHAPWRWEDGGRVLVWADGATIAFREELADILQILAPHGLPPFHAVALLLAACRGKYPQGASNSVLPWFHNETGKVWNDPANQDFSEFIARLRQLHDLPAELRNRPQAKARLIEAVFEGRADCRIQPADEIVQWLRLGLITQIIVNQTGEAGRRTAALDRLVSHRLASLPPAVLALRLRTGLDELPAAAAVDLKPAENVRQLLSQLQNDPEHEGLAKITRDVMAALYLPRSVSEMDELPLGGYSDLSNRGSLDRLLPSELANDDLTLAVRIALNEALYIRREPPANRPPGQFALLIDAGVRTWGLPRVFATAVALALAGKEEQHGEVSAWRATRDGVEKVTLNTREGLVEHLSILHSYAHPGPALKPFFAEFAGKPEVEAVLVTQRDTLVDPDFQSLLREVTHAPFYIATVDRDGSFELFLHPHPTKLLCQAEIALERLLSAPDRIVMPLRDGALNPNLPLILSVRPFPFLLPVTGKVERFAPLPNGGGVAVMQDRRLLRWQTSNRGAETLANDLPTGKQLWLGLSHQGDRVHVLTYRPKEGMVMVTTWRAATGGTETQEIIFPNQQTFQNCSHQFVFPGRPTVQVFAHRGMLYLTSADWIAAFDLTAGHAVGGIAHPSGLQVSGGRYFQQRDGRWIFLTYDGQGLNFQPVTLPHAHPYADILALFDREGYEGPWAITRAGEILSNTGERIIHLQHPVSCCGISIDGHRIGVVRPASPTPQYDLINLATTQCSVRIMPLPLALDLQPILPMASLRRRFDHIHLSSNGQLYLHTPKGVWLRLVEGTGNLLFLEAFQPFTADIVGAQNFKSATTLRTKDCDLQLVTWPDGCRTWLDSRGLLHLRGASAGALEISLVLAAGPMAAWCSNGEMTGGQFFLPKDARLISAREMLDRIKYLKLR